MIFDRIINRIRGMHSASQADQASALAATQITTASTNAPLPDGIPPDADGFIAFLAAAQAAPLTVTPAQAKYLQSNAFDLYVVSARAYDDQKARIAIAYWAALRAVLPKSTANPFNP